MFYVYLDTLYGIYEVYEEELPPELLSEDDILVKVFEDKETAEKFVDYVQNDEQMREMFGW